MTIMWSSRDPLLYRGAKKVCNQERIPFGDPCRGGDVTNVPPYPMKIAPPDGQGMV